ncbi:hypothetical protein GCM10020367_72450 [Streptomyces sannanensis]|uniref:Uncharacterized protein n=1 Tax=Streptomyces sannanensis TaxID=285536 RepID=A0ABP6SP59_9ACTN
MATLGAVYDAEPAPRTVDDIIADPDQQDDAVHGTAPERRHQQQELIRNHQTRYRDQVIPTA